MKHDSSSTPAAFSSTTSLDELMNALTSGDQHTRHAARTAIVKRKAAVVPPLIEALASTSHIKRLEAARCLRDIGDMRAAPALVRCLQDESDDVRWVASEAMVALGEPGLPVLLRALETAPWNAGQLRQSAHHILREFRSPHLSPVVDPVIAAMDGRDAGLMTPLAAYKALEKLED